MTFLLGCEDVSLEFATKKVLSHVSVGVNEGDRIGVVGRNGDGKSSLLALLNGSLAPDSGRINRTGNTRVGLLAQRDALDDADTVTHAIVGDTPAYEWASDARIREILERLVGDIDDAQTVGTLSGGQRRRVDLARVLIGDYDVLLLDEPTNHLDIGAIDWLAQHLKRRWPTKQGAFLVVTHDRWFLDEVCEEMWEVHDGGVEPFEGGYSAYVEQRVERDELAARTQSKRRNLLRRELAWLSRGARARSSKPRFHVEAAQALIADEPPLRNSLELRRTAMSRLGKQVVDLEDVTVRFGKPARVADDAAAGGSARAAGSADASARAAGEGAIGTAGANASADSRVVLDDVDWIIGPGDRYGILGENGAGKTTLLSVIQGRLRPTSGRVKIGKTVRFAVLSQRLDELEQLADDRVREVCEREKRYVTIDGKQVTPGKLLENLGFDSHQLNQYVRELSGGQKRRLQLMLILLDEPNVLILDEPGNDLDIDMLAQLEALLDGWPGTLLLVTHDRYLMEHVTDDQFALIDGRVRHVPRGVDEYLELLDARSKRANSKSGCKSEKDRSGMREGISGPQGTQTGQVTAAEAHELGKQRSSLERRMGTLRSKIAKKQDAMTTVDPTDYIALGAAQQKIQELADQLEELEDEWLAISEKLGE